MCIRDRIWEKNKTMIKKRVILVALSFLFAHDPDNKKIVIDDFIRIGFVSNAEIAQNGLGSFYRLKRVTNNTFRDLKMYAHFFDSRSELKMRVKSSNKYDFNSNLYHFTTYSYHKSGNNLPVSYTHLTLPTILLV